MAKKKAATRKRASKAQPDSFQSPKPIEDIGSTGEMFGEWEQAAAGAEFLSLKDDGDQALILPVTVPTPVTKPKFKGKRGEMTTKFLFAAVDLSDDVLKLVEISGKDNNKLKTALSRTWGNAAVLIERHGKKGDTNTTYSYTVDEKTKIPFAKETIAEMRRDGASVVKGSIEYNKNRR